MLRLVFLFTCLLYCGLSCHRRTNENDDKSSEAEFGIVNNKIQDEAPEASERRRSQKKQERKRIIKEELRACRITLNGSESSSICPDGFSCSAGPIHAIIQGQNASIFFCQNRQYRLQDTFICQIEDGLGNQEERQCPRYGQSCNRGPYNLTIDDEQHTVWLCENDLRHQQFVLIRRSCRMVQRGLTSTLPCPNDESCNRGPVIAQYLRTRVTLWFCDVINQPTWTHIINNEQEHRSTTAEQLFEMLDYDFDKMDEP